MGFRTVITGQEHETSGCEGQVRELLQTYLKKIRRIEIEKPRRGMRGTRLLRVVDVDPFVEGEDDADALLDGITDETIAIARDDASTQTKRARYVVIVLGDGVGAVLPELGRLPISFEVEEDTTPATRESELVATCELLRNLSKDVMGEYLKLAAIAPKLVAANAETAQQLGTALASATTGQREWDFRIAQMEADSRIAVADLDGRIVRSDRMWSSFDHFFEELKPYLDIAAAEFVAGGKGSGGSGSGPTDEELDHVFGEADPDFAQLAKKFRESPHGAEADSLREALRRRWNALANERKTVVMGQIGSMARDRVVVLGAWMKRNGLT